MERWEQELESEAVTLCQGVLGIEVGDIVVVESGKSLVRLEIEGMSVYPSDDASKKISKPLEYSSS